MDTDKGDGTGTAHIGHYVTSHLGHGQRRPNLNLKFKMCTNMRKIIFYQEEQKLVVVEDMDRRNANNTQTVWD